MGLFEKLREAFSSKPETTDDSLRECQRLLGYSFKNTQLLELSLTHRSVVRATNHESPSNERLEFLGDSVLGLAIAHQLFKDFPDSREGDLTKARAMLVNETTLAQIGTDIGLNEFIRLSPEEEKTGGRCRTSIVSDAFESVIGAVYLDSGYRPARDLVLRLIYSRRDEILADDSQRNYKGDLLELAQAHGEGMPRYDVINETGPDHEKTFHVTVMVGGEMVGEGTGMSKKEAEQKAAAQGLENYQKMVGGAGE